MNKIKLNDQSNCERIRDSVSFGVHWCEMGTRSNFSAGAKDETWVAYTTNEGHTYYFNTETLEGSWDRPDDLGDNPAQLAIDEIKVCDSFFRDWREYM